MQFNFNLHLDFNLTFKHWLSQIWLPTLWRSNFSFDSNFMACKFKLNFKFAKQIVNNMACRLLMALCDLPVCCAFELWVLCATKPAWHEWHPIPVDFWVDLHHWGGHNCCRRERKAAWHAGDAGVVDLLPRSQAALPCGVCKERLKWGVLGVTTVSRFPFPRLTLLIWFACLSALWRSTACLI